MRDQDRGAVHDIDEEGNRLPDGDVFLPLGLRQRAGHFVDENGWGEQFMDLPPVFVAQPDGVHVRWQAAWQEAPKDPMLWYHRALSETVDNAQKAFRILEGHAQAVTKSAERLSTTAEQAGKGIQETFSSVVTKMKEVYAA